MHTQTDLIFLKRTLTLAEGALAQGTCPIAALLVRDNQEISFAISSTRILNDLSAHAEVLAIKQIGIDLSGGLTLYSSLEPCLMCLAASSWANVSRIVYGCKNSSIDPSYYTHNVDINEASKILFNPPEIVFIDTYALDIQRLIEQYEKLSS